MIGRIIFCLCDKDNYKLHVLRRVLSSFCAGKKTVSFTYFYTRYVTYNLFGLQVVLQCSSVHIVADLIKMWFRELPEPLLSALGPMFKQAMANPVVVGVCEWL